MSLFALSLTLVFVLMTMVASIWQKLGLEKDIAIGTVRAAIQLLLVGYLLQFIFDASSYVYVFLVVGVMITVAAFNAASRARKKQGALWRVLITLATTEAITVGLLLLLQIVEPTPQYVIPLSGMIIGNAMVASSLFLNHMNNQAEENKAEIETILALGGTAKQAIHGVRKRSIKYSMIPTIDSMKTIGLVQLPGMMTGMIIAGADPVEAVRYQILIVFTITASAAVTSMLLSSLTYKLWFTSDIRMK